MIRDDVMIIKIDSSVLSYIYGVQDLLSINETTTLWIYLKNTLSLDAMHCVKAGVKQQGIQSEAFLDCQKPVIPLIYVSVL